ncbi:MAG: DUF4389 domain-containing protein [Alphaproteobacteria bacterium]
MSENQQNGSGPTPEEESGLLRLAYMVGYGLIAYVMFWLTLFSAAVQIVVRLVTGAPNQELVDLGARMAGYLGELFAFLTFQTEVRPFPFNEDSTDVVKSDDK